MADKFEFTMERQSFIDQSGHGGNLFMRVDPSSREQTHLVNVQNPQLVSGLTPTEISRMIYLTNPTLIVEIEERDERTPRADEQDEVYGESQMSWEQAVINRPQEFLDAEAKTTDILNSRAPEAELVKFIGKDGLLGETASFTWMFGPDWFVETRFGNFHWRDSDYGDGDDSFTFFEGGFKEFLAQTKMTTGRDKGRHLIATYCENGIELKIPQLDE